MDLAQEFILKAQNELNESDDIKVQSLDDFRTWLARHDYFIDCRKGESSTFPLKFLFVQYHLMSLILLYL